MPRARQQVEKAVRVHMRRRACTHAERKEFSAGRKIPSTQGFLKAKTKNANNSKCSLFPILNHLKEDSNSTPKHFSKEDYHQEKPKQVTSMDLRSMKEPVGSKI